MIKAAGGLLLTAAGCLSGLLAAQRLSKRLDQGRALCQLLRLMAFKLERFLTPLPELFDALAHDLAGSAGDICRYTAEQVSSGVRFSHAWEEALRPLPAGEREILMTLGAVLGQYGPGEQAAAVTACLGDMTRLCDDLGAQLREKRRIYIGACTAGGLMLAVLLM